MSSSLFQRFGPLKYNGYLVLAVIFASILLLLMNYYTIRILSGVRAYIHGESLYSKGQKDASSNLIMFIETEESRYWHRFEESIQIPLGDRKARIALLNDNEEKAREGLLEGNNHPDDLKYLIWLFQTFQEYTFMKEPVAIWAKADSMIMNQVKIGEEVRSKIYNNAITDIEKHYLKRAVYEQNTLITELERQFLDSLGKTSRQVSSLILMSNTFFILAIVGGKSLFSMRMIKRLSKSENRLQKQNKELKSTNDELDRFVYSASHDLRSPITSLKGLINIMRKETDSEVLSNYLDLMDKNLNKQDIFIQKIINFSKNKRSEIQKEEVDIEQLIDDIIDQHRFLQNFSGIIINKSISPKVFKTDAVRLEIILSNLISNAIKFADPSKSDKKITVKGFLKEEGYQIVISDNGLGIDRESQPRIFEMFYRTSSEVDGTGVGLYVVKETIEKLNGNIEVLSEKGSGTTFSVTIPA